jgi:hypothetical protein
VNRLILKEMNDNRIIYLYYPNGGEAFGEVEYLFSEKQAHISKKAKDDETCYFANKAVLKVEKYVEGNTLPLKAVQAWY